MKKLMIAAAAAAMVGGAFAEEPDLPGVYNLKFTLKTIVPKTQSCGKESCTICKKTDKYTGYYYENGTVKLEGLLAYCAGCTERGEVYGNSVLAMWDAGNKQPLYVAPLWKNAGKVQDLIDAAAELEQDVAVSNVFSKIDTTVYGKSSNKVGIDMTMDLNTQFKIWEDQDPTNVVYDLRAVGLGSYCWDQNLYGYVKSVSGNVAGRIPCYTGWNKSGEYWWNAQVVYSACIGAAKYCTTDGTTYNTIWTDDEEEYLKDNPEGVPAYGTWTMKFNKGATNKDLCKSLPSWLRNML